jgi:DNA ligase D-like protein (predicted 3'-phosphoesterase)
MVDKDKLKDYRKKRDFGRTSEPEGSMWSSSGKPIFVIQKHDASHLHYDFRLEVDGVLKSWAVPKGPSTDPNVKRMAIFTEDHPIDYAGFEGVIPEGEYGGGAVLVWDRGTYENIKEDDNGDEKISMAEAFESGRIAVRLDGQKIKGGYALIKTKRGKGDQWLLIKMKDKEADARRNPVSTQPESVLSGRTLEQIRNEESEK